MPKKLWRDSKKGFVRHNYAFRPDEGFVVDKMVETLMWIKYCHKSQLIQNELEPISAKHQSQ